MQRKGAPRILLLLALLTPAAGCAGTGSAVTPSTTPSTSVAGPKWIVVATGSPSTGPTPGRGARSSPTPTPSFPPVDPSCGRRREPNQVLIPVTVTVAPRALGVQWPGYGGSAGYRVAAVPQKLVNGEQPPVAWQSVGAGNGCTITAAITGLRSGEPYVVWLDAPGSGHRTDGSRLPYSGRSRVVYPG